MKRVFTKSDFKKFCQICGRHGHEDESCAAIPTTFTWFEYSNIDLFLFISFLGEAVVKKYIFAALLVNGKPRRECTERVQRGKRSASIFANYLKDHLKSKLA